MYEPQRQTDGGGLVGIVLVLLYVIFDPIPAPVDDCAATAVARYHALKS